jgi:AraC-like DNA-binding protein
LDDITALGFALLHLMADEKPSSRRMIAFSWMILQFGEILENEGVVKLNNMQDFANHASAMQELAGHVERAVGRDGLSNPFGSVWVSSSSQPTLPSYTPFHPLLCVVAQGTKRVFLGDECYNYDPQHFLLACVTLPATGQVIQASPDQPYLGITIGLEPALVESVIVEAGLPRPGYAETLRAMESSPMEPLLLEAVLRLARLLSSPQDATFLAPLAQREIIYRLLTGHQAARLHQIASQGGQTHRVVRAIEWLRHNYEKPLRIESLARESRMSVSALHHHFKNVTAMSPLQFQKQLRLQEAKRLMLGEGLDAANAGYKVGYEDPSYFSREYRNFFGDPPRRHVAQLMGSGGVAAS